MPEVGSLNQRTTLETSNDVVRETLIFSEVVKNENFNAEDHVIFVVPDSSDLVTTEGETTSFVIPSSEGDVSGSSYDTSELRETIKSNFLVIAKLLPSKSPPPLVSLPLKESNGIVEEEAADEGIVIQRISNLPKTLLPKPTPSKAARQPKAPRQSNGKNQSSIKQESPEIFGKMFPASYNEVLWKQIREIIYFKCGKETTDDTEVIQGINCPHCRKKPTSMNKLKEHLQNCHTYSTTKRKSSCPSGKNVIKKMLYRCQYCDEAFISTGMRDSHECSLAAKPLEHLGDITKSHPNTCSICYQEFGSRSELSIHLELDHPESSQVQNPPKAVAPAPPKPTIPSISKYVSCKICHKKISTSILEEHLRRHQGKPPSSAPPPPPQLSEQANKDGQDSDDEPVVICPICDVEVESAMLDNHVNSHYKPSLDDQSPDSEVHIALCAACSEEFKVHPGETVTKCKNCR
uniref:C2H2-type domain-containing protein n=1 Tax=Lygus hesperus TaxID=30085 RepID=A0A0A9X2H2_LYGHE